MLYGVRHRQGQPRKQGRLQGNWVTVRTLAELRQGQSFRLSLAWRSTQMLLLLELAPPAGHGGSDAAGARKDGGAGSGGSGGSGRVSAPPTPTTSGVTAALR